jgi:hypothetical protein
MAKDPVAPGKIDFGKCFVKELDKKRKPSWW